MEAEQRARRAEDHIRMAKRAMLEVDDLCACPEWDHGDDARQRARAVPCRGPLDDSVQALHASLADGNCGFANLLKRLNATHCMGIDTEIPEA